MARTKTGIDGLDELLHGGIPTGNLVVVLGTPGSGKTILSLQYLYAGATKYKEPGVYISLEEPADRVKEVAANFGWDFDKLIKDKLLDVIYVSLYDFEKLRAEIDDAISRLGAKRIVIDPASVLRMFFEKDLDLRKALISLGEMLKQSGVTALLCTEIFKDEGGLTTLEEYVADGAILLYHTKLKNSFVRAIGVLKMRNTSIEDKLYPLRITEHGIDVLAGEEVFNTLETI